jgi:hypothetical protein
MRCPSVQSGWLTSLLLVGCVPRTLAQQTGAPPMATSVVATITTIDPATGLATLQTAAGEQCALPTAAEWKVGATVVCDRSGDGPRTRLHQCRPWP